MKRVKLLGVALVAALLGTFSAGCGDENGGGGVCVADYGIIVECFDCWDEDLCVESSSRTWHSGTDSCADLGYTSPTSNNCGYTR